MKKQQGFSFTFETYQTGTLIKIFVSMVLFCGLYACFWSALALSNTNVPPYLPATAGLFYCAAACKLPKRAGAFQVAAMVILLVYIGFAGRYIIDGWNVVMNSVFQLLERRLGYIFPRYELTQAVTPDFCAMLFLVLPAILLGMLSARAVCGARWWRAGIILLCLLLSAAILLSIYPPDWCCVLLALGLMFSCLQHTICFNTNPTRFRTVAAFSMLFLFLLAVCAVPALLWNESGIADAERNRLVWNRFVHQLRYEDHSTTLPEGDFKELQSFCPGDTTAITITMDSPRELYLRGFVGETYLGDGWTALESEQKAEYATLFSWLHERGFYGQTQFAQLCEALGESGGNSVSVQVEDTCTAWRYAAYEASDAGADPRQIGDADLPSSGLWGECAYTFSLGETPITQYQRVSDQLAAAHKAELPTAIAYLTSENAYRTYVYDNYLTVPADTQAAIAGVFAGLDLPKTGNVSFFDAQLIVSSGRKGTVSAARFPVRGRSITSTLPSLST